MRSPGHPPAAGRWSGCPERSLQPYYVVSEALTNAAKHAHASVVHVGAEAVGGLAAESLWEGLEWAVGRGRRPGGRGVAATTAVQLMRASTVIDSMVSDSTTKDAEIDSRRPKRPTLRLMMRAPSVEALSFFRPFRVLVHGQIHLCTDLPGHRPLALKCHRAARARWRTGRNTNNAAPTVPAIVASTHTGTWPAGIPAYPLAVAGRGGPVASPVPNAVPREPLAVTKLPSGRVADRRRRGGWSPLVPASG
jgi:hypothetical protein